MANPTTNFGWVMPTSTDLVTDLPADFNVFGQGVDTSMQYLLGGTTGQVLSKTSGTNMAFTWVTPTDQTPLTTKGDLFTFTTVDARLPVGTTGQILSADPAAATGLAWITNDIGDITSVGVTSPITGGGTSGDVTISIQDASTAQKGSVQLSDSTSTTSSVLAATPTAVKSAYDLATAAIAKSTVTTAGDIIYRNATVPTRLGIGTAGQVLAVNSGATAPEWTTAAGGGMTLLSTTTVSSATTTISSISGSYTYLLIYIYNLNTTNANPALAVTFNGASTFQGLRTVAYNASSQGPTAINDSALVWSSGYAGNGGGTYNSSVLRLDNYSNSSYHKPVNYSENFYTSGGEYVNAWYTGKLKTTSAITSMTLTWGGTTGITGTVKIYGGM